MKRKFLATALFNLATVACSVPNSSLPRESKETIQDKLIDSIGASNLEQVKSILKSPEYKSAGVNQKGFYKISPLLFAINGMKATLAFAAHALEGEVIPQKRKDDVVAGYAIIDELLRYENKITAEEFVVAGQVRSVDLMKKLLPYVSNINMQNTEGMTALMTAAQNTNLEVLSYLLAQPNIDPNIKNNKNNTALIMAIKIYYLSDGGEESLLCIKQLLKYGAVIDSKALAIAQDPFAGTRMADTKIPQEQKDALLAILNKKSK